jgi:hypothetical protein
MQNSHIKNYDHFFKVSKKNGKYRTVYVPTENTLKFLSSRNPTLLALQESLIAQFNLDDSIQGFRKGKNPVTNASLHQGFNYTLSFDLLDFFDSVSFSHLQHFFIPSSNESFKFSNNEKIKLNDTCYFFTRLKKNHKFRTVGNNFPVSKYFSNKYHFIKNITTSELDKFFLVDGFLPQGFSSSPILANIAFLSTDLLLKKFLLSYFGSSDAFSYTRYADDITISFNDKTLIPLVRSLVDTIISTNGFKLNRSKTHFHDSKNGNLLITGVSVCPDSLSVSRKLKKKIRAAKHQNNIDSLNGLLEWSFLKLPSSHSSPDFSKSFKPYFLNNSDLIFNAFPSDINFDDLDFSIVDTSSSFCPFDWFNVTRMNSFINENIITGSFLLPLKF